MDMFTSYMVILISQNKNTDFLMILAWLCRFKLNVTNFYKTKAFSESNLKNLDNFDGVFWKKFFQ